jgi:hypothetical protein
MATRLVTLATFSSPVEAALARNILAEAGIRAEATEGANASVWGGMLGGVKLLVDENDLERAGELLDEALGDPLESEDEPDEPDEHDHDETAASDFADNLADRSPAEGQPAWTCVACGARVGDSERRCWSCGATRRGEVNPYYVRPESAVAPPPAVKRPPVSQPPEHVRDLIDRAWRAACLSPVLLPPLMNFYSAWLLLSAGSGTVDLPASYNWKFYGAMAINLFVTAMAIMAWIALFRGSFIFDFAGLLGALRAG